MRGDGPSGVARRTREDDALCNVGVGHFRLSHFLGTSGRGQFVYCSYVYTARSKARATPLIHEKRRLRRCVSQPQRFALHATADCSKKAC